MQRNVSNTSTVELNPDPAAEPAPAPEPPWPKAAYGLRPDGYCTDQDCGQDCCLTDCGVAPGATHHVLYMHTEKTGGASIECATQAWQAAGWWTNMGHTTKPQVEACENRCARAIQVARVLTVRDPYAYWQSVYRFAWHGQGEWLSSWLSWHTLEWSLHQQRTGILQSFPHFMEWVEGETELLGAGAHGLSQASRVFSACGDPCEYDVLLRTENLSAGWRELVTTYELPKMALPHLNGALNVTFNDDPPVPKVDLVPDVVGIINRIDAPIFDRFGYTRRPAPFVASVAVRKADVPTVCAGLIASTAVLGCCVLVLCCGVLIALVARDNQSMGARWRAWRDRQTSKKRAMRLAGLDEEVVATGGLHVKGSLGPKSAPAPPAPPAPATELGHASCKWAEE
jgi:hypothetical protein